MQILTLFERQKIEFYLRCKYGIREIARHLERDHSVVSREIRRNLNRYGRYVSQDAQRKADFKARQTNHRKLETDWRLHDWVDKKLKSGWSPELIAGRLKEHPPKNLQGLSISHEQIYEYIYEGEGRWEGWHHYLVRKQPKRRQQKGRKPQKTKIPERISIHERPLEINRRERIGDWESDLALFRKQQEALSVQYERTLMLTRLHRVENKSAEENTLAIATTLDAFPSQLQHSLTFDNGLENVQHIMLKERFGVDTFFCDPYSAWQKGGVENTIGLIRRYLPRHTQLATVSNAQLQAIEDRLNNRPRKRLNYLTPNEALSGALNS
jgi:transposase, IS30 family